MELHLKLKQDMMIALKTLFSFSKYSEMVVFPKKLHWNMIFFALSGKMIILFSKNILFFRRKMKGDLSRKCDIFCGCSEKRVFPKNRIGIWCFLYYQKKMIFLFPKKTSSYYLDGKWNIVFPKNSPWIMTFLQLSGKMVFLFPKTMISLILYLFT